MRKGRTHLVRTSTWGPSTQRCFATTFSHGLTAFIAVSISIGASVSSRALSLEAPTASSIHTDAETCHVRSKARATCAAAVWLTRLAALGDERIRTDRNAHWILCRPPRWCILSIVYLLSFSLAIVTCRTSEGAGCRRGVAAIIEHGWSQTGRSIEAANLTTSATASSS